MQVDPSLEMLDIPYLDVQSSIALRLNSGPNLSDNGFNISPGLGESKNPLSHHMLMHATPPLATTVKQLLQK
jgi:hypothetical protein